MHSEADRRTEGDFSVLIRREVDANFRLADPIKRLGDAKLLPLLNLRNRSRRLGFSDAMPICLQLPAWQLRFPRRNTALPA